MANLTISIDDAVLRKARVRALEQGTSVNALLRAYLERYADASSAEVARGRFADLAESATGSSGPDGRRWRRDDIHERG